MKLNHAQKKYLLNKLDQILRSKLEAMKAAVWKTTVVVNCEVKINVGGWSNDPSVRATDPTLAAVKKHMAARQIKELDAAVAEHRKYTARMATKEKLMSEFEEQLLFSDGGLEEANTLLASFAEKMK